jgi:hypothetical protein
MLQESTHISVLPVWHGERVVALLTDTIRATSEGYDPKATKVWEVMTCQDGFFLHTHRPRHSAPQSAFHLASAINRDATGLSNKHRARIFARSQRRVRPP